MSAPAETSGPPARYQPRHVSLVAHALLAALAFVPLLLTARGRVASDTRQYFFVDPTKFLERAVSLWDPNVHLGTVTHSNVGNLFPMGTFFTLTNALGIPAWAAQRLWIGLVLFAAGAGVLFFARTIAWCGIGPVVAALVYMLTPYTLQYAPRTSVLLLPYAALPWLVGLSDRAVRTGGWRHPAAIALVVMTASGANPSALLMVMPGPVLWIAFAVARHEVTMIDVGRALARTALLTAGTCALWITALALEARYGLNVLLYTETLPQVSVASTAMEMLRGLGYWLFYGTEARDPNIGAAVDYLERTPFLALSYLVPGLAVVAAFTTRWRHRAFAIALLVTGVVLGVGAYPYDDPSPYGRAFRAVAETSSGLALRSSARAVPLTVLGVATLLGAGTGALASWARRMLEGRPRTTSTRRRDAPRIRAGAAAAGIAGVVMLVVANMPALFTGGFVDENFSRPSSIPRYWRDAAAALDGRPATRVLELPGSQFAAYRFGMTYDTPILPTLLDDRPSVAREQTPYGAAASVDLLGALDRRLQEGTFEPAALAPVARLLGVGDVLLRSDLEYERYATARPRRVWELLGKAIPGLGAPRSFGVARPNEPDPRIPLLDPITLGLPVGESDPPPVAVRRVNDPRPVVRAAPVAAPVIVAGDGEGIVDAATAGLVTGDELVLYAPWLTTHPQDLVRALRAGADLVITDTNRRRDRRWRSLRYTTGLTDRPGHSQPRTGQGEAELEVFPDATDASRTVTLQRGATVDATRYGGLVTFDPDQRAAAAFDGDPTTAWQVGEITDPVGQSITIRLPRPRRIDHLVLLQSQGPARTRFVQAVALSFDGGRPITATLDERSRTPPGQRIDLPARRFRALTIEITAVGETPEITTRGASRTGFAEIAIPGVSLQEVVRLPHDVTDAVKGRSLRHRLAYVLTRARSDPADTEGDRRDEEARLVRRFAVPDARGFALTGTARLSARAPEDVIDAQLGTGAAPGRISVRSSDHLAGAIDQRAWAALDGDVTTRWTGDFLAAAPNWLEVQFPDVRTIDRLDLAVVADGRHSVPTRVRLVAGGDERVIDLPPIADRAQPDATVSVPVRFAPLTGPSLRVELVGVRTVETIDTFTTLPLALPPSIAELGIPDAVASPPSPVFDTGCRTDLVELDGHPVPVRITGTAAAATARDGLAVSACGTPLALSRGPHELRAAPGARTGIDLDRIVLVSERGGDAARLDAGGRPAPTPRPASPKVRVTDRDLTSATVRVGDHPDGFWLILAQSHSEGWEAKADGRSLGDPALVDGFANGWLIAPGSGPLTVELRWAPQRLVWIALGVSIGAVLASLVLAVSGRRWPGPVMPDDPSIALDVRRFRRALPWRTALVTAAVVGLVSLVLAGPLPALCAALVSGVALRVRRGQLLLAAVTILLLAASFLQVVRVQRAEARPVRYDWARGYETEHRLAMTALVLLAADPAIGALRRRRGEPPGSGATAHREPAVEASPR